jgi:hypothetical protein
MRHRREVDSAMLKMPNCQKHSDTNFRTGECANDSKPHRRFAEDDCLMGCAVFADLRMLDWRHQKMSTGPCSDQFNEFTLCGNACHGVVGVRQKAVFDQGREIVA